MMITTSQLRANIYKIFDRVLKTGEPLEIPRRGKILKIVPPQKRSKISSLKKMGKINTDPEGLVHIDWSGEWKGKL